jgi:nucleoside-diphosphate-sugar epimerase
MKLLITGTDGYIGAVLAAALLERGHEVTGLDTGFYREGWLYHHAPARFPVCINHDIRHITEINLKGFQACVHLAELSNDPLGQLNPEITFQINHLATVALARQCKQAGVARFIYTSSCSVYGAGADDYKTEESPTAPQTAYARCKVLVERDVSAMADEAFSPTFLRNATAYGPSPRMRFDLVLNNLAGLAWTTRQIKMSSDGSPWRPLAHVLDICEAIACALEAPREVVHNQIFNVGDSKENFRVREIARIVAEVFPGCELVFGSRGGDNRSYRVSFEKINSRLPGFKCKRNAKTGAAELRALFERIAMTREIFEFRAFTRLKQLQYLLASGQIDRNLFWQPLEAF